jgi:type I restriction enzyme S subunit
MNKMVFSHTWVTKPLIEVATLQRGYDLPVQDRTEGPHPIFAANGTVGFHDIAKCKGPGVVTGRSGTIGKVHYVQNDYWPLNTSLYVKDFHGNDPKWVFYMLRSFGLERFSQGVGVPTLNRNLVHGELIRVPPLSEQRRIAAILDKAETLRAMRQKSLAYIKGLAQSIFIEMFGDPLTNPKDWATASLTEICYCYSGGTPTKDSSEFWTGATPWFSAKDMKRPDLFDAQDHISDRVFDETSLKLLPEDTVAIVVRGMILAHTFPVSVLRVPAAINQDLKALLPKREIDAQFLAACLRAQSKSVLSNVSESAHGTKRLDTEGLSSIQVLLPSIELQKSFATRMRRINELKSGHERAVTGIEELIASFQQSSF